MIVVKIYTFNNKATFGTCPTQGEDDDDHNSQDEDELNTQLCKMIGRVGSVFVEAFLH